MLKYLLLFSAIITVLQAPAQAVLSGKITDKKNRPISFASVYIKNSTYGTTTNEDGNYKLKLNPGTFTVVCRSVGYKQQVVAIQLNDTDRNQDIQLEEEPFQLQKVKTIRRAKDDPAMGIMHKVVQKRKFYLSEINAYSCSVYIQGVKIILSSPKTLLAKGIAKLLDLDTSGRGISYQSESLSSFSFKQPDKVKEIFLASKSAGTTPPFGYNKASDLQVNFYKNLFFVEGLNNHGFVSPAGAYAFSYYRFKLLGRVTDDGVTIAKIQVIPKNAKALSFNGIIYILENDSRIYSVDLLLTKKFNDLNFIDTLRVTQQYIPIGDSTWEPISFQYRYHGSVQGFKFRGYYLGINNGYKIDTVFKPNYFNGEILHVDTAANKRSKAYWAANRKVPLTAQETRNDNRKDSMKRIQESEKYIDSAEHAQNRFRILPYVFKGYLATHHANKDSVYLYPLAQTIYYNTVEGYGVYLKGTYSKYYEDNSSYSVTPVLRYGFSNKLFSANLHTAYTYDQAADGKIIFNFGSDLLDLNSVGTRSLYFNTLSTLLSEQNFVKYYRSQFVEFGHQRELANGILWLVDLSYADRTQLFNTSYNHLFTYSDKHYTSNNPLNPDLPANDRSVLFPRNQALIFNTSFRFTFDQQYITRPTGKLYVPSIYPVVTLNYRKGIQGILGSDVDYDFLSLDILQSHVPLGLFGHSSFELKGGEFLNRKSVYYMDYNHFLGNQGTTSDPTYFGSFHFLHFYTFSTDDPFLEAHYQHNFSGAILDNFPFLRNLKLEEIVGANYLTEKNNPNYFEVYAGLKRLIFGIDYGVAYQGNKKYLQGIRVFYGLK